MPHLTKSFCTVLASTLSLGLATPLFAGPLATPTATATTTSGPSPPPGCAGLWPVVEIMTLGKGQSPSNNPNRYADTDRYADLDWEHPDASNDPDRYLDPDRNTDCSSGVAGRETQTSARSSFGSLS